MSKPQGRLSKTYRIMWDQNHGQEGFYNPPMTPEREAQAHLGYFEGTPVDAYVCALGPDCGYTVSYPTKVKGMEFLVDRLTSGARIGNVQLWRNAENMRLFWEAGIDPMQIQIDQARRLGIDFWFRLSMNDWHHWIDSEKRELTLVGSPFYAEHPEYLIGKDGVDSSWHPTQQDAISLMQDYAHEEVRRLRLETAIEACERYDVTGFEYDFMRCPGYFKYQEVEKHIPLMTDMIRKTRVALDKIGERRGKALGLSVRVPNTIAGSLSLGLDVPTWIKEDLVDIVVPSTFFNADLEENVTEWVKLTEDTPVRIYPAIEEAYLGGHTSGVTRLCYDPPRNLPVTLEMINAIAARHWRNGVDGIYTFNYFGTAATYNYDNRAALDDIGNPLRLKHKNKRYVVMRTDESFPNCLPRYRQLPATPGDDTLSIHIDVADDLASAGSRVRSVILSVHFKNLTVLDKVEVKLNGHVLECANPKAPGGYDPSYFTWLNYDLKGCLPKMGDNVISLRFVERNQRLKDDTPVTVEDMELGVEYDYPNGPWIEPPAFQPRT